MSPVDSPTVARKDDPHLFNHPYDYENPDEWRLPPDTAEIPYRFGA